jgi:hypothetical protein
MSQEKDNPAGVFISIEEWLEIEIAAMPKNIFYKVS